MTRREYVWDVWLPEHATFLLIASLVAGGFTAPSVPGFAASTAAWLGAACLWCWFLLALRWATWRPWREAAAEPRPENVVPLRPPPKGLH